jgi:hypothetical protein
MWRTSAALASSITTRAGGVGGDAELRDGGVQGVGGVVVRERGGEREVVERVGVAGTESWGA